MLLKEFHRFFLEELKMVYEPQEASAIITKPERSLESDLEEQLKTGLKRLKQLEPVQYVIGHAWFCDLSFKVSPAVLVPRPETEELVQEVLNFLKKHPSQNLLDIGTGSGCIPISIKNKLPVIKVTAIDVSEEALTIAI